MLLGHVTQILIFEHTRCSKSDDAAKSVDVGRRKGMLWNRQLPAVWIVAEPLQSHRTLGSLLDYSNMNNEVRIVTQ